MCPTSRLKEKQHPMRYLLLFFFLFFSVGTAAQVRQDIKPSVLLYPQAYAWCLHSP